MMYDIEIAKRVQFDMRIIYEYITDTLLEPAVAEKQLTRIEDAVYSLEQMPERFRRYEKEPWRSRNLRVMRVDNYVVLYIVDNKKRVVTVIRVMYGKRDIERELDDMSQK
jgi:toxin ParE1/3/4